MTQRDQGEATHDKLRKDLADLVRWNGLGAVLQVLAEVAGGQCLPTHGYRSGQLGEEYECKRQDLARMFACAGERVR